MKRDEKFAGFLIGVAIAFIIAVCVLELGGCKTTCVAGDTADVIARDSQLRGRLEATIDSLDGTISDSRNRIRSILEDSREIASGAERLDYLFFRYEQEVERLVNSMRRASDEIKDSVESYLDADRSSSGPDSGVRDTGDTGKKKDN